MIYIHCSCIEMKEVRRKGIEGQKIKSRDTSHEITTCQVERNKRETAAKRPETTATNLKTTTTASPAIRATHTPHLKSYFDLLINFQLILTVVFQQCMDGRLCNMDDDNQSHHVDSPEAQNVE